MLCWKFFSWLSLDCLLLLQTTTTEGWTRAAHYIVQELEVGANLFGFRG